MSGRGVRTGGKQKACGGTKVTKKIKKDKGGGKRRRTHTRMWKGSATGKTASDVRKEREKGESWQKGFGVREAMKA